jgi:hypothetical protein
MNVSVVRTPGMARKRSFNRHSRCSFVSCDQLHHQVVFASRQIEAVDFGYLGHRIGDGTEVARDADRDHGDQIEAEPERVGHGHDAHDALVDGSMGRWVDGSMGRWVDGSMRDLTRCRTADSDMPTAAAVVVYGRRPSCWR